MHKAKRISKNVLIETFTVRYPSETPVICHAHHHYSDFLKDIKLKFGAWHPMTKIYN